MSHQIIKNGFNALRKIPASIGPLVGFKFLWFFFWNIVLICKPAKPNNPTAPIIAIKTLNSGIIFDVIIPAPKKTINGNSTIVWPIAIFYPAIFPSLIP